MIDKEKILLCINDFNLLDASTLTDLQKTIEKYPYFQTGQLLYFINLYKENNQLYNLQLKFAAAYASDRTLLHKLVNDFNKQKKENTELSNVLNSNQINKIDSDETNKIFITANTIEKEEIKIEVAEIPVIKDFELEKVENNKTIEEIKVEEPKNKESLSTKEILINLKNKLLKIEAEKKEFQSKAYHYEDYKFLTKEEKQKRNREIIDKFISTNPSITRNNKDFKTPEYIEKQEELVIEDVATETFANIFIKQKRFDKAIEIYNKLILKFPEKSSYFAVQIENLKIENLNQQNINK